MFTLEDLVGLKPPHLWVNVEVIFISLLPTDLLRHFS